MRKRLEKTTLESGERGGRGRIAGVAGAAVLIGMIAACRGPSLKPVEPEPPPRKGGSAEVQASAARPTAGRASRPPIAEPRPARDTYHGVTVEDPYRWLEGQGDDVKQWSDGQNHYARSILDRLPEIDTLHAEISAYVRAPITRYFGFKVAGGKLFALRRDPAKEQLELIALTDPAKVDTARLVFDPTARGGAHQTIDWFVPAPDGKSVAVSISENGSEVGSLLVLDLDGKELEPTIPNVQRGTGLGDLAWTPDSKGFYYTRYPSAGEKPDAERDFWMQVWFHQRDSPLTDDRYEYGKDFPKIAEVHLERTDPPAYVGGQRPRCGRHDRSHRPAPGLGSVEAISWKRGRPIPAAARREPRPA